MGSDDEPSAPPSEDDRGRFTVLFALAMDAAIAIAKLLAFLVTGSSSMLAETLHSGAETANQTLLLWGRRQAEQKEASPEHPFGFSAERYFWPFIVSMLMFTVGAVGSVIEGIRKLVSPEPLTEVWWAFGVLAVALVLDGASGLNAVRQAREAKRGSYWQYIRRTRRPEVAMVLLQDTAAVVGLLVAVLGIGLTVVTGVTAFDAMGSFAIGVLLGAVALILAREMKSLLIGESALPEEEAEIRDAIEQQEQLDGIVSLRTLYLGPEDLLIEAKVHVGEDIGGETLAQAVDEIEDRIRDRLPHAGTISIEPDIPRVDDPERAHWQDETGHQPSRSSRDTTADT